MIRKPKKLKLIALFRKKMDAITDRVPWPNIHPNYISGSEIILALIFVLSFDEHNSVKMWIALGVLILGNIFDAVDGSIARKYHYDLEKGWIVDVVVDRITELIIFILFPWPWLAIWFANLLYTIIGYRYGYHTMLALRIPFLIYFVIVYFIL